MPVPLTVCLCKAACPARSETQRTITISVEQGYLDRVFFYTQTKHHASRLFQSEQRGLGANVIGLSVLELSKFHVTSSCVLWPSSTTLCLTTRSCPMKASHTVSAFSQPIRSCLLRALSLSDMQTLLEMQETASEHRFRAQIERLRVPK